MTTTMAALHLLILVILSVTGLNTPAKLRGCELSNFRTKSCNLAESLFLFVPSRLAGGRQIRAALPSSSLILRSDVRHTHALRSVF